ncbi:MAG: phage tail protein [Desulfobacterales bacterium]|nr:phage tail protein [Desulfobacterales bacterium]
MTEPYIGEIRMFAGSFAPRSWAFCDGQLLSVSQFDALFSLLGTIYGGDGRTTFGLPDLRGRLPVHMGQGPGLSNRVLGQRVGEEHVTLAANQMPNHSHSFMAGKNEADATTLSGNVLAKTPTEDKFYADPSSDATKQVTLKPDVVQEAGGGQHHANLMPYICVHFIIALVGNYPPRT